MLAIDIFLYLNLYHYLDQVTPDGNGVKKPYLYFINWMKTSDDEKRSRHETQISLLTDTDPDKSSAKFHEEFNNNQGLQRNVQLCKLTKDFGETLAVDHVTFSIYERQILCLLGHNGAGKTTTINMLTGLVEPTSGDTFYEGISFKDNLEEARSKIGLCNQHDVLFTKLTVREHLQLIARLRNIPADQVDSAINDALAKMNLIDQQDKYSETLSGGNKRKLCLAMAVLGSVKVLLLDEPTSGMDPQNRRIIWQHIRELKASGLTILMTTHHLDEAEELADRVAIMSRGKLLALGSSDFIKRNFGEGYYLTITPSFAGENAKPSESLDPFREEIEKTVMKIIEGAKRDEQTAPDVIKFLLPFKG